MGGAEIDCIGFTERHRDTLAVLDIPVILSNAVVAKAVGELFGGRGEGLCYRT